MAAKNANKVMDKLVSLAKRRGFIFQSSEIYGGINSCYDYGPLGVEMKKNIKELWWKSMVYERDDIEGLDASILMHPKVWEASGHVAGFSDPLVDCKVCKTRFRADQVDLEKPCPVCGNRDSFTEIRQFNLMFKTFMGPVEDSANVVFLRPETAQGIYVNFHNVREAARKKLPFGIAQIGKAFRNEITPGNFIFRTREFEQMEMQYFVKPGEDEKWFEYWKEQRMKWYQRLGLKQEKLRFHQHAPDELAHYAKAAFDIEYEFPFGWNEIEGIHNRTDFDLSRHQEFSGKDLRYFDDQTKERFIPYIIETSVGCDRTLLTCLVDAYTEEEERVVLKLAPAIAPIKAAVLPLVKRDGMPEIAKQIVDDLRGDYRIFYDDAGSIGRRYRRMDEAGTPFCVTVDSQTLEDQTVTVRERDSMQQERVHIKEVKTYLDERLKA
ncbi:glycyl-tRNA synthetase [Caldithrix abyssi DSM 13497]|uniref:Glycine--tRNA ligase n=2 Tax=Caldithrix abyssi TaxID=187145 RepID=H1XRC9_CALAY|nr:glycine--tRNA ligase [Caldithrix abyssi]APF18400.1 glyQS glycyl-tRNA synthetase [Caldithrix abyssi DSM 13497]EHO42410.1 glycyl-tRNA synthetase [Caldithrix abyssi DSM 13497]